MSVPEQTLRDWDPLDSEQQRVLRVAFGHRLDTSPPAWSREAKVSRCWDWLGKRSIQSSTQP